MKKYKIFTAHDFAMDTYFQAWVLRPDESTNAYWNTWLHDNPQKVDEVNEARELLSNFTLPQYTLSANDVGELWQKIKAGNGAEFSSQTVVKNTKGWYWAAAALFVLSSASFIFWNNYFNQVKYVTAFGETKTIVLPDSSTVILNANSEISFGKNWEERPAREVWLKGEAFFSIAHKEDHQPFKVNTSGGVAVEVLGTTFDVYHRAVDTRVVLNSGQIALSFPVDNKEKKILMKPGELFEYKEDKYNKKEVDPRIYAAWTENKIILNQTTLRQMIQMAKDNYNVDIKVETDAMLTQTVSGSMPIGDAKNFVNQIAKAFQLKVVENKDGFLFTDAQNSSINK